MSPITQLGLHGEPSADPAAVVVHGEARFTVLTPRLIRLEWAPSAAHDDRPSYAFPTRRATPPPFRAERTGDTLTIDTGALLIIYHMTDGPFTPANLAVVQAATPSAGPAAAPADPAAPFFPGAPPSDNLRGARRTLDGCRGEAALEPGLLARTGWTRHDDSAAVRFDPATGWVQPALPGPRQDWYLFAYGRDYRAALADYSSLGGRVPMIPRWALGAWWSRYWAYSEQDLRALVGEFAAHGIPLDVLVIDMDWHLPDGWTGYSWNRQLFPDPPAFLGWLHDQGLRTTLNLHPADGVQPFETGYHEFARALGQDPGEEEPVPFRVSDPRFVEAYFQQLHHPLEDQGVDFWWMDWQQGRTSELPGLDALPWLNHLHYHDMRRRTDRRPIVFSRWGGLGNHRYPIGFSGDTFATWEALRFQPYFTATAANVLYGWWSHDIGGHFDACAPELYARWVQLGALGPILRLHATKDALAERRPWAFPPAVFSAVKAAFEARYALIPYLYTLARRHSDHGLAPCRPMYYDWPDHEAAYLAREQYMLGDQILVAPVVHPADPVSGLAPVDVWVPPGDWIERRSGEFLSGPRWQRLFADLYTIPQLVRTGAILPLADPAPRSHLQPRDHLTLDIFPGPDGVSELYDDTGEGEDYAKGQYEWTSFVLATSSDRCSLDLTINPTSGRCDALPEARAYTLRLAFMRRPTSVQLQGAPMAAWHYDETTSAILIDLPASPKTAELRVQVTADAPLSMLGEERNSTIRQAQLGLLDPRRLTSDASHQSPADPSALQTAQWSVSSYPPLATPNPHAIARLGGPFARIYEYTAPEDAARSLGALLLAAPHDGTPARVTGTWRLHDGGDAPAQRFELAELRADTSLPCPFAWDGRVATLSWSLDLELVWRGETLRQHFSSQTLFPTIGQGLLLVRPAPDAPALDALLDSAGGPRAELPWQPFHHTPAHGEFQNLTERFNIPLGAAGGTLPDGAKVGYVAVTIDSPDERTAVITYQSPEPPRLWLNGAALAIAEHIASRALGINPTWSHSAPAQLRAGRNTVLLAVVWPGTAPEWGWFLHMALCDTDDRPLPGLAIVAPVRVLQ